MKSRRRLAERLLSWYDANRRDLPWRREPTPYRVWVSEIMLQQTRVETVQPYYERFLRRFPDLESLARAAPAAVEALWSGLGYYRRVRSLHAAARKVIAEHGGEFPRQLEAALALPGVGPYTAGAILSIAYNLPVPVLDGNVERVLSRLLALRGDPARAPVKRRLRREAERILPAGEAARFNQALMELGALVCLPATPKCEACPVSEACRARAEGDPARYPEKAPKREPVAVDLAVLVLTRGSKLWLERTAADRTSGSDTPTYLRGVWNFPALEVDDHDSARQALETHMLGTWGREVEVDRCLGTARHAITYRRITLHAWQGRFLRSRRSSTVGDRTARWIDRSDLGETVPVPSLVGKVLRLLDGAGGC